MYVSGMLNHTIDIPCGFIQYLVGRFLSGRINFSFSALTLFPGLFTVPLMRMTDLLRADYLTFKLPSVYVPVFSSELTRTR